MNSLSAAAHSISARCRAEYSSSIASWIIVSSRCVAGLSTGMRAFSASSTSVNATAVNARLGYSPIACVASRPEITGSAVVAEISEATKITISSAGSARKPTIISRRAPSVPNAVPTSIAASDMNTRAVANSPTSAMASAAGERKRAHRRNDRRGDDHRAEDHVRRGAEQRRGILREHGVLVEQLVDRAVRQPQAGCSAVLKPGAALCHPAHEQRRDGERRRDLKKLGQDRGPIHSTSASSAINVRKLYIR